MKFNRRRYGWHCLDSGKRSLVVGKNDPLMPLSDQRLAGVDEAGRGAWAGPVVAAATILPKNFRINHCQDSKKCSPQLRRQLCCEIRSKAVAWAVGSASVSEIDRLNILQASMLAMRRALARIPLTIASMVLVDGSQSPLTGCVCVVQGDARVIVVSAASILAKVWRDNHMEKLDRQYPDFQFASNKGYGTPSHRFALHKFGVIQRVHRLSYRPVQDMQRTSDKQCSVRPARTWDA